MSLAQKAARGVAWNMIFGVSSRALTLVSTLVLTRLVAPHDYGAVLAASISVLTAAAFTSFAFGQYLIARRSPPGDAFQAAVLHFAVGAIAMAVLYLFRHALGNLIDTPDMAPFIGGYAIAQLIDRTRYVPERLLVRDLRFRILALINGTGEVLFVAVALAMAPWWGAYAMVFGTLARSIVTAILFFNATPRREWLVFTPLQPDVARNLFGYGLPIMIAVTADRAAMRWDNLIVAKLFGAATMAQYNLAFSLAEMPITNVAVHISDVLMPSFSRLDDQRRRDAVLRTAALMGLIAWPLGIGLASVAPTLVDVFFDERWQGIAPMLTILAVMTVFVPMTLPAYAYLQAVQRTRAVMIVSLSRAAITLPLVAALGSVGGPEWACAGAALGNAFHGIGTIVVTGRVIGLPMAAHLWAFFKPALPCVPMWLAVEAVTIWLTALGAPAAVSLIAQVAVGGAVFAAAAALMLRSTTIEIFRLAKGVIRGDDVARAVSLESNTV